nr:hypothetical protein [Propionivibrio sp.]
MEKVRQLLDPHREELVAKAVEMAMAGDGIALRLCLDRISPPPRSESPPVRIPGLAAGGSMSDKARAILAAAGKALISPDTATMMLGAIANAAKIIEADELADRITALESKTAT